MNFICTNGLNDHIFSIEFNFNRFITTHPSCKMIGVLKNYALYKSGNVTIITHGQPFEFNCLYVPLDQVTATEMIHPARPVIKF